MPGTLAHAVLRAVSPCQADHILNVLVQSHPEHFITLILEVGGGGGRAPRGESRGGQTWKPAPLEPLDQVSCLSGPARPVAGSNVGIGDAVFVQLVDADFRGVVALDGQLFDLPEKPRACFQVRQVRIVQRFEQSDLVIGA